MITKKPVIECNQLRLLITITPCLLDTYGEGLEGGETE